MSGVKDLDVLGVRVEMPTNQPIVLLRERDGDRYLPIWVGAAEAAAIAYAQQGVIPPRPLTHDLLASVINALGRSVVEVRIVELKDSIFHAELVFDNGVHVNSRTSDGIALALRTNAPIRAVESLMDEAGIAVTEGGGRGQRCNDSQSENCGNSVHRDILPWVKRNRRAAKRP